MPTYLVRFVDKKYLPNFSNPSEYVIQLGSFKYYRKIEDERRSDTTEGQKGLSLQIKKPCTKLDGVIAQNGYGNYSSEQLDEEGNFQIRYILTVHEHLAEFNSWVLCCSKIDDLDLIPQLMEKFDCCSHYFITDVEGLINSVQRSLATDLKTNPFGTTGAPRVKHPRNEDCCIDGWKKLITYVNASKFMQFSCETLTEFLQFDSKVIDQKFWFQKPLSFEEEQEFRFVLFPAGARGSNKRFSINEDRCLLTVDLSNCISEDPIPVAK